MKVVIVGGVAGGASAAARLRRLDEEAEIIIIERTGYISYANCGLPYFVSGDIANKKKLTLQTPESFKRRFNVEVRVLNEVTAIDPSAKSITVKDLKDGTEYEENYDKLLLATGARPIVQNIPGAECNRVFSMQTVEDALALEAFISAGMPKNAVIAGGGYVGLEMAECLTKRGVSVKMVHRSEQLMKTLDYDMACEIKSYLKKQCVEIMTGTPLEGVTESEGKLFVTAGGKSIPTDMVLLALGTVPSTKLAADAGLKLGVKNAVLVDKHMRTSDPDIYAVGDAVQIKNLVSGKDAVIPLAGPANRQGRLAADNICGIRTEYNGASGASVFKLFDMTVAAVGLTESEAENAGIPYESVVLPSSSHAAYYPGASSMTVKAVFCMTDGKLLGTQIIGFDGVDKRIDVAATAIRCGMNASELASLDLAYAPPYSSAKDPINVIGSIAENVLTGKVRQFHWNEVAAILNDSESVLLDVRTDKEVEHGIIKGAIHIPLDDLRAHISELDKGKRICVYCQSGLRSYLACRILSQLGFKCATLAGGYSFANAVMQEIPTDRDAAFPCGVKPDDLL